MTAHDLVEHDGERNRGDGADRVLGGGHAGVNGASDPAQDSGKKIHAGQPDKRNRPASFRNWPLWTRPNDVENGPETVSRLC